MNALQRLLDQAHDPGPIPENESGLIDWGLDDPEPDPVETAELLVRLAADSDRILTPPGLGL